MEEAHKEEPFVLEERDKAGWAWSWATAALRRGWSVGKKVAIAGAAITAAPVVVPPVLLASGVGLALAFPFGVYLVGFAATNKLMSSLLPIPDEEGALESEEPPPSFDLYVDSEVEEEKGFEDMEEGEEQPPSLDLCVDFEVEEEKPFRETLESEEVLPSLDLYVGFEEGGKREGLDAGGMEMAQSSDPFVDESKGEEEGSGGVLEIGEEEKPKKEMVEEKVVLVEAPVSLSLRPEYASSVEDGGNRKGMKVMEEEEKEKLETVEVEIKDVSSGSPETVVAAVEEPSGKAVKGEDRILEGDGKEEAKPAVPVESESYESTVNIVELVEEEVVAAANKTEEPPENACLYVAAMPVESEGDASGAKEARNGNGIRLEEGKGEKVQGDAIEESSVGKCRNETGIEVVSEMEETLVVEESVRVTETVPGSNGMVKPSYTFVSVETMESVSEIEPSSRSSEYASAIGDRDHMADTESEPSAAVVRTPIMVHLEDKASFNEEMIWEQIYALRTIVGYKADLHPSLMEELRALCLFTGVEPPVSLKDTSDLAEVSEKLCSLKSIIGVK